VIHQILTNEVAVWGVTLVDDELFALLERTEDQVAVYSTNDYQLLRHLNVPDYDTVYKGDIASCVAYRCLYMSNFRKRCIHKYALSSSTISNQPVPGTPVGLSFSPNGTLLVTCHHPMSLLELSVESGQCVREIALRSDMTPWHGIQLANGQFAVCHGTGLAGLHEVRIINDDGKEVGCYGGISGSINGYLDRPCHLAVDKNSNVIFVADSGNKRVVSISSTLAFVSNITEGLSAPNRLYVEDKARRLYVCNNHRVAVFQL